MPPYLALALAENHFAVQHRATFAMACFWEGEARLGGIEGVVATRPVYLAGREAVSVTYDETRVPFERLVREAARLDCAERVWVADERRLAIARGVVGTRAERSQDAGSEAGEGDRQHDLGHSPLRALTLTPMQATHVNAALHVGSDPLRWLSPRQREQAARLGAGAATASHAAASCKR